MTFVTCAGLYARENIAAQTGLGLTLATIPAPAAGQSPWGINILGETLHYAPGLGWQVVAHMFTRVVSSMVTDPATTGGPIMFDTYIAPRNGTLALTFIGMGVADGSANAHVTPAISQNGVLIAHTVSHQGQTGRRMSATVSATVPVTIGDVFEFYGVWEQSLTGFEPRRNTVAYVS